MATLGSLVVSLEANMAKFQSDMGRAVTLAENSANKIGHAFDGAKEAIKGMGEAFAVREIYEFGMGVIESASKLAELHIQTGLSVTALSALKNEAALAGTDLESATSAFDKMQKNAFLAAGGNTKAAQAFAAIGISAKQAADGLKNPDELLRLVSEKLSGFVDDGNKAALMMELFGKSGASMSELLRAIAENGFSAATATAEEAKQAKEAADAMAAWKTQWEAISLTVVTTTLPVIEKAIAGIKLLFAKLVTSLSDAWAFIKLEGIKAWQSLIDVIRDSASKLGTLLEKSPFKASRDWGRDIKAWGDQSGVAIDQATLAFQDKVSENEGIMKEAWADYMNATTGVVRPTVAPPTASIKPPSNEDAQKALRAAMDARIKILEAAAKNEDLLAKQANAQLDADYAQGALGLVDYANEKQRVLATNLAATLGIYDAEEIAIRGYIKTLKDKKDVEAANGKLGEIAAAREKAQIETRTASIALTEKLTKDGQALAKSIIDVNASYALMTGNTALANALQTEQNDAMLKASLLANGLTDDYNKLLAVEKERALYASKEGSAGAIRALRDYAMAAADAANQVQNVMGSAFKGLEDQLVNLVAHGKADFRSLANSIIADIARITIQRGITGPLATLIGSLISSYGGGTTATSSGGSFFATADYGGGHATGGAVMAGVGYTVGEAGPETFVPNTAGTIVPNGGNGGAVSISTTIDARGATTDLVAALPGILKRNNEALKSDLLIGIRRGKYPIKA